ncbi:MAG: TIGR03936 family radical SAM-associated protein [Planctomycetia bacterium]|nr:TIGR03936 family radical SAM-associated protein [Planctomycetia bacterium]
MEKRSSSSCSDQQGSVGTGASANRSRYRIHYTKKGNVCFIGHRDLIRAAERMIRRARLPIALSEGFHPKPRISYLSVLPLGFASEDEVLDLVLTENIEEQDLLDRLNAVRVEGIDFLKVDLLAPEEAKKQPGAFVYRMALPDRDPSAIRNAIQAFLDSDSFSVAKSNGKIVDARIPVRDLSLNDENILSMDLAVQKGPEAGVKEILTVLQLENELFRSIFPVRTKSLFL